MMHPATVSILIALASCGCNILFSNIVFQDPETGYSVSWRDERSIRGWPPEIGDRGEAGDVNPAIIEYIFAAPEGPFTRYYDLMLSLADRPRIVNADLAALEAQARKELRKGDSPRGRDYARALGRRLARPIRDALRAPRGWPARYFTTGRFEGMAVVRWGVAVDIDDGIPTPEYECDYDAKTYTTILRYQSVQLIVMRSSATRQVLAWDVSNIPGAFQWDAPLDQPTVAARIVALHPIEP
jgi:hypothetical protein